MSVSTVESGEVRLHVRVSGAVAGPFVVLVHGFPDTQDVWSGVVPLLEPSHRVVTYDVRGAGRSTAPVHRSGYRVRRLVDDLVAVLDHAAGDQAAHLVGHDWGSTQLWEAVLAADSDPRLRGRIASFTSISGPSLVAFGRFLRGGLRRGRVLSVGRQLAASWYIAAFRVPGLAEFALARLGNRLRTVLARHGRSPAAVATFDEDLRHGLQLYRANGVSTRPPRTDVPVQLIVATRDAFVTAPLVAATVDQAPGLRRVDLDARHWVVQSHPREVADAIAGFVAEVATRDRPA